MKHCLGLWPGMNKFSGKGKVFKKYKIHEEGEKINNNRKETTILECVRYLDIWTMSCCGWKKTLHCKNDKCIIGWLLLNNGLKSGHQ